MLLNKIKWFVEHRPDWEIIVVTTDQQELPPFYTFPPQVKMVDLGINYSQGNNAPLHCKISGFIKKRALHRQRLTALLMQERADIVVSLYPGESSFIPDIKDGSKKVLELHFNRYFRLQYGRNGLLGLIDRLLSHRDAKLVRRFDGFVVLTQEDAEAWGNLPNISVIPNAAISLGSVSDHEAPNRVIAVGRLDYQKGFDRLIQAWSILMNNPELSGWRLDIFGQGEWHSKLTDMIVQNNLQQSVTINAPVNDIAREYHASSMLVMSSHYEGFPMVMIEAMGCGLPVVSFDFKCGPRDIISQGVNGLVVPDGDIDALARAMSSLMLNGELRRRMGQEALKVTEKYSTESVMKLWLNLFESLCPSCFK